MSNRKYYFWTITNLPIETSQSLLTIVNITFHINILHNRLISLRITFLKLTPLCVIGRFFVFTRIIRNFRKQQARFTFIQIWNRLMYCGQR